MEQVGVPSIEMRVNTAPLTPSLLGECTDRVPVLRPFVLHPSVGTPESLLQDRSTHPRWSSGGESESGDGRRERTSRPNVTRTHKGGSADLYSFRGCFSFVCSGSTPTYHCTYGHTVPERSHLCGTRSSQWKRRR